MVEVIPLRYGATFKRVFSELPIFRQFVKDVLGISLNIDKVYTEYEYPEAVGYVKIKYDLFAEDHEGRIIIEVQHVKAEDFFDRFLYYHLTGLLEQTRSYLGYKFGKTVYTIVILTTVPEDKSINFSCGVMDMSVETETGERIQLYPHRLFFLTPRLVNPLTPEGTKAWLELISDSLDGKLDAENYPSDVFQQVIQLIQKHKITSAELAAIKEEEGRIMSQERSFQAGKEAGMVEGLEAGRAEGLEAGKLEEKRNTARKMLATGWNIAAIVDMTGLPETEIAKL